MYSEFTLGTLLNCVTMGKKVQLYFDKKFSLRTFMVRLNFKMDFLYLHSPAPILFHRRLSMRPSQEELEERNILKSEF